MIGCLADPYPRWRQLVFPQVPVKEIFIYMDKDGLLDGPGDTLYLPAHNGEAVHIDGVSCSLNMLVNGGLGSEVFP